MGEMETQDIVLVRKPKGKRQFGREDNIKMDLRDMGCAESEVLSLTILVSCREVCIIFSLCTLKFLLCCKTFQIKIQYFRETTLARLLTSGM
jgi:hypothetical protein